jgi:hypothetical protein
MTPRQEMTQARKPAWVGKEKDFVATETHVVWVCKLTPCRLATGRARMAGRRLALKGGD